MRARIQDYRAIGATLELPLNPICLLVGRNEAGKTSASQAVGAALTGETLPDGRTKRAASGLIHKGAEQAIVEVSTDEGLSRVVWPDAKAYSEGKAPWASLYAAGLRSLLDLSPREYSRALMEYLQATPDYDDLAAALGPQEDRDGVEVEPGLSQEAIKQAWESVTSRSWDDAASLYRQYAQTLKGRWQEVTGEGKWGTKKGRDWRPSIWDRSIAQSWEETLQQAVDEAREREIHARAAVTIEDSRRQELQQQIGQLPELEKALSEAEAEGTELSRRIRAAQEAREALPPAEDRSSPCPHCGEPLRYEGGVIVAAEAIDADEIDYRAQAIDDAERRIADEQQALDAARDRYRDLVRQVNEARQAQAKLAEIDEAQGGDEGVDPDEAHRAAAEAQARLDAFRANARAQSLHAEILETERVARVLEPDGLRKQKLTQALSVFNGRLTKLSSVANWRRVQIDDDLAITYGGWHVRDLSASAYYRVRVILQVAMAQLDGSDAVIVDGADILHRGDRNGLINMLRRAWHDRPALLTITADGNKPDQDPVPDLAGAGIGTTVRI